MNITARNPYPQKGLNNELKYSQGNHILPPDIMEWPIFPVPQQK